jgi:hypothetical protein
VQIIDVKVDNVERVLLLHNLFDQIEVVRKCVHTLMIEA